MMPVTFKAATDALEAPSGLAETLGVEVHPLPVCIQTEPLRSIMSAWKPSPEELAVLISGGAVAIQLFTHTQPAIGVGVLESAELGAAQ